MRSEGLPVQGENPLRTTGGAALMSLLRTVSSKPGGLHFGNAVNIGTRRIRKSAFRVAAGSSTATGDAEAILREWVDSEPKGGLKLPVQGFIAAVDVARRDHPSQPPHSVLSALFDRLNLPVRASRTPRPDGLDAAVTLCLEVARVRGLSASPGGFLDVVMELEELRRSDTGLDEAVSALTVHRAKGLEFRTVFVLGVQGDTFPNLHFAQCDPEVMEAERRLFYVALTRTKEELLLSNHARCSAGARQGPDRDGFIRDLPSSLVRFE